jgi:hypothetical protein
MRVSRAETPTRSNTVDGARAKHEAEQRLRQDNDSNEGPIAKYHQSHPLSRLT